jgi:hypothetical protein
MPTFQVSVGDAHRQAGSANGSEGVRTVGVAGAHVWGHRKGRGHTRTEEGVHGQRGSVHDSLRGAHYYYKDVHGYLRGAHGYCRACTAP